MKVVSLTLLLVAAVQGFGIIPAPGHHGTGHRMSNIVCHAATRLEVWVEDAEDDFVDKDENLEEGEVCIHSVKAFASDPDDENDERFLCAGALLRRPSDLICDAWTADAVLPNGGPNLQLKGAVKVLDELFLCHLKAEPNSACALRNFVLQCGSPGSEFTCASHMAGQLRGFRPLRDMVQVNSIYAADYYEQDLDGMVFDYYLGKRIYEQVALSEDWESAAEIWMLLPDDDTIELYTEVKGQEQDH